MAGSDIEFVLFDLGGVLIELGDLAVLRESTGFPGDHDEWQRALGPWIRRFETGQCSASEFSAGVVAEWGVDTSPGRILEIFRAWPVGPYPGTAEVLSDLKEVVAIGCLSNTNVMHWADQSTRWPFLGLFDHTFLSFELGLAKPDRAIFQAVAERLPHDPDRVLFMDDMAANADAARAFGFRSVQVQGIDEAVLALRRAGVLD